MRPSWTAVAPLPGGENMTTPQALCSAIRDKFDWVPTELARRWATTYVSRTWRMLEGVHSLGDMGEHIGAGLYTREVDYLCSDEWAIDAHDILWRSEEHTSELQSLMRISYAVFCLKKKNTTFYVYSL